MRGRWGVGAAALMGALALVAVLPLAAGSANAREPGTEDGPFGIPPVAALEEDLSTMYQGFGDVDVREAHRRLDLSERVGMLQTVLDGVEDRYSGMWIEEDAARYVVVIRGRSEDRAFLQKLIADADLEDVVDLRTDAEFSVAELLAQVREAREAFGGRADSTIDLAGGSAVLFVTPNDAARATESSRFVAGPPVDVRTVDALSAPTASTWGGQRQSTCTAGFTVRRNSNGLRGILTAGHCSNSLTVRDPNNVSLTTVYQSGSTAGTNDQQWSTTSAYEYGRFNTNSNYSTYRTVIGTRSRSSQAIGSSVCKFGRSQGYKCGTVVDRYMAPGYLSNPDNTFMRLDSTGLDICASPGDSGGPMFYGSRAYGIVSGAVGPAGDHDCIYMAINYVSNLGLSVYVP